MVLFANLLYYMYYRLRNRGEFWRMLKCQALFQYLDPAEIKNVQFLNLKKMIKHAYDCTDFYNSRLRQAQIYPENILKLEDIQLIPPVTKADLRSAYPDGVKAKGFPESRFRKDKTSGSTNTPFEFFKDETDCLSENVSRIIQYSSTGYRIGDKRIIFRGEPEAGQKINMFYNSMKFISCFGMNNNKIPEILSYIKNEKPKLIESYPSAVITLAEYMKDNNIRVHVPKILTAGEMLTTAKRALLEKTFSAEIFDSYGASEAMYVAVECSKHNGLHYDASRFLVEIVDKHGRWVAPGEEGDILITSLTNFAMPFIRYRIGDRAVMSGEKCTCGRNTPLIKKIKGREVEQLKTADGRIIDFAYLATVFDKNVNHIHRYKIIETGKNVLELQIVPRKTAGVTDLENIRSDLQRYVGDQMKVELKLLEEIPLGRTGKHLFFESHH